MLKSQFTHTMALDRTNLQCGKAVRFCFLWGFFVLVFATSNLNVLHKEGTQPWPSFTTAALSWFLASASSTVTLGRSDHVLAPTQTVSTSLCVKCTCTSEAHNRGCVKNLKKIFNGMINLGTGLFLIVYENNGTIY